MEKLGVYLRSKIPIISINNQSMQNEETLLIDISNTKKSYSSSKKTSVYEFDEYTVDNTNMNFNNTNDLDDNYKLEPDLSANDLHSLNGRSSANKIDEWQAGWNVTNAIQGMFVVSLPYAIANGGYWAFLAMILVAYVCCYTGKILVDCLYDEEDDEMFDMFSLKYSSSRRRVRIRTSYVDIAKDVWGSQIGGRVVNIAQNIELLMTCILYLVLCGDLFVGSFPDLPLDHSSWTMISCMVLIPCAFIRSLKFVSRLSFCNAVVHLIINAIILIYCVTKFNSWDFSKVEVRINIWSFPISLGIIVFSYTSQIFLPTMEGNMIDRKKFDSMLNISHFVAAIFKASFGYLGFLTWQEDTDEVITNNLPTKELKIIVNMILVVKALLSYPLPYFASVELLESSFFMVNEPNEDSEVIQRKREKSLTLESKPFLMQSCYDVDGDLKMWAVLLRICLILFTLFLAIFIPHFAILMGLIGSITGTMLSLIWPCYFHLHLKRKSLRWYQIMFDIIIICFGLIITVTGVYYSSVALIKALKNQTPLPKNYYKKNNFFVNNNFESFNKTTRTPPTGKYFTNAGFYTNQTNYL